MTQTQNAVRNPVETSVDTPPQRAKRASGDFGAIGTTLQIVGELLCEATDVRAGSKVLDAAPGNAISALAAARRWCDVTAVGYVPDLLNDRSWRSEAERLSIRFGEADRSVLPFANDTFDVVLSSFGFALVPDQSRAARELMRVCRPAGRIGLASWTPCGFVGQLLALLERHVSLQLPRVTSGVLDDYLDQLFRDSAADIDTTCRHFIFRYRSAKHWMDVFRQWYGPMSASFARLSAEGQRRLERDVVGLSP
jgi:ubiquinone/menaquinone biosynthesis C-methylase UbiE